MIQDIILAVLSSGVIATLVTLKATRMKATAEARSVEIDNNRKLLENFENYIVEPLKTEVNELRTNIRQIQEAVAAISACPHRDACPVGERINELFHDTEDSPSGDHAEPDDPDPC